MKEVSIMSFYLAIIIAASAQLENKLSFITLFQA